MSAKAFVLIVGMLLYLKHRLEVIKAANEYELKDTRILVAIPSVGSRSERLYRSIVRKTWKQSLGGDISLLFFIGTQGLNMTAIESINEEQRKNRDIVKLDYVESYEGLSDKMLLIYQWIAKQRKNNLEWIFKTDTDIWFNPEGFKLSISNIKPHRSWLGRTIMDSGIFKKGPWANPDYPSKVYPSYHAGAGYAITMDSVSYTHLTLPTTPYV